MALKLLLTLMSIIEDEKVYWLYTNILFLIPIALGVGSIYDTHLWQFSKAFKFRQDVTKDKRKYHIATSWQY